MKKKPFVIFIILFVSIGLFYVFSPKNKQESSKKDEKTAEIKSFNLKTIENSIQKYELLNNFEFCENTPFDIKFGVSGKLIIGDVQLEEGVEFKKNQLLYRIDNRDIFSILSEKKTNLSELLKTMIPQLEISFANEKEKWILFQNEILPVKVLPELPPLISPEERVFLVDKGFMQAYIKVKMLEKEMGKYYYLAPFDGVFLNSSVREGEVVTIDSTIAKISDKENLIIKTQINKTLLSQYKNQKNIQLINKKNKVIGNAKLLNFSKLNSGYTFFYKIYQAKADIEEMKSIKIKSILSTPKVCSSIPNSLIKNGSVNVLVNNVKISKSVTIIATNNTNVYVTGLSDGDQLILD
jgi:hypothetical protein